MRTIVQRVRQAVIVTALAVIATFISPALASASEPSGIAFGRPCPAVQVIAVPGSGETNETASADLAVGQLKTITDQLVIDGLRVPVHYIGYPAVLWGDYWASKDEGYANTYGALEYYGQQCAGTKFVLLGFSQGAHIAGDLAATIGRSSHPVSADRVLSVHLLADPARNASIATVGIQNLLNIPYGRGLAGTRDGFGSLSTQTIEYCTFYDIVCNATPESAGALVAGAVVQLPHLQYGQITVPGTNQTFTDQITNSILQNVLNPAGVTF